MPRLIAVILLCAGLAGAQKAEVPSVDGGIGACWVDFSVTQDKQPVYNAKIHVLVRYGFRGVRKMDLQVGTNYEGKARIAGLPKEVRKPLEFDVRKDSASTIVTHDPATNCHASLDVTLPSS